MTREVTAFAARTQLGELMDHVRYTKEPCVIMRHGKPVAVLLDYVSYTETARDVRATRLPAQYDRWLQSLVADIVKGYRPEKIILFGSVARGAVRDGSDIDLCIIKRTRKRRLDRSDEVTALTDAAIPLDVVVLTPDEWGRRVREGDALVKEVLATGRTLYDAKK